MLQMLISHIANLNINYIYIKLKSIEIKLNIQFSVTLAVFLKSNGGSSIDCANTEHEHHSKSSIEQS